MFFSDIHTHILYGADDGAESCGEMFAMIDAAYNNGTRLLCATPHFCPTEFGDNNAVVSEAFDVLKNYCEEKYPDLELLLGNELFYMDESVSWLKRGLCKTIGKSRCVLVEFNVNETEKHITEGLYALVRSGYVPILAHTERYSKLSVNALRHLCADGVLIQVNSQSLLEGFSFFKKMRLKILLAENLVDFVSTDAHSSEERPPMMKECYDYLSAKYGKEYAEKLCFKNAFELFSEFGEVRK